MISVKKVRNPMMDQKPEIMFRPIVDEEELNMLATNEDVALLLAIGYKYDGRNTQFAKFACRMLGIESEWAE